MLWGIIFLVGILAFLLTFYFLAKKVSKFPFIEKLSKGNKNKSFLISILLIVVFLVITGLLTSAINAVIIAVHIILFWLIGDGINLLLRRKFKGSTVFLASVSVLFIYLIIAAVLCFHVSKKEYQLVTSKDVGSIRIVQFADSHLGTTFDGEGLNEYVDMMNECQPDVVLITGDFVDDASSYQDMVDGCKALSRLETTYGVYYSFGNHDKGYSDHSARGFSGDDLIKELEKNGVIVLEDETVLIDDRFYIIGRQDRSEETRSGSRSSMEELTSEIDSSKYIVVMDHQPNDYDAQAKSNVDLVLSGHTHGGQMLPINRIGELIGANDYTYGLLHKDNTDFIVTSGISDWELLFKSGCNSEFVVIDINN